MRLFANNDELFESIHGEKLYTLCDSFDGKQFFNHVTLKRIPTLEEAMLIMNTLSISKAPLQASSKETEIDFSSDTDKKRGNGKFSKSELEILGRLLSVADHSDYFEGCLPKGCKSNEDVWEKIDSIRQKIL